MHDKESVRPKPLTNDLDREVTGSGGGRWTVRQLRERVSMAEPGVVLYREIASGTPETLAIVGQTIEELVAGLDAYAIVIDLADAADSSTTSEYRRFIPNFFKELNQKAGGALKQVSVVFYGNPVLRVVTKFLVGRMMEMPFSIHSSRAQALQAARHSLQ
jgi:hypothetical protein